MLYASLYIVYVEYLTNSGNVFSSVCDCLFLQSPAFPARVPFYRTLFYTTCKVYMSFEK